MTDIFVSELSGSEEAELMENLFMEHDTIGSNIRMALLLQMAVEYGYQSADIPVVEPSLYDLTGNFLHWAEIGMKIMGHMPNSIMQATEIVEEEFNRHFATTGLALYGSDFPIPPSRIPMAVYFVDRLATYLAVFGEQELADKEFKLSIAKDIKGIFITIATIVAHEKRVRGYSFGDYERCVWQIYDVAKKHGVDFKILDVPLPAVGHIHGATVDSGYVAYAWGISNFLYAISSGIIDEQTVDELNDPDREIIEMALSEYVEDPFLTS